MNKFVYLSLILFLVSGLIFQCHAYEVCGAGFTQEEIDAALDAAPWESITHSHDSYGEHTHEQWVRQVELPAGCLHIQNSGSGHPEPEPEPEPEPPTPEGYTTPNILVCIGGPCLEKRPTQFIGPIDVDGNCLRSRNLGRKSIIRR